MISDVTQKSNVIAAALLVVILVSVLAAGIPTAAKAQGDVERRVDSLFVIASSGEVKHRDLVEPAIEAIAEIGVDAVPFLIDKFTTKSARERLTVVNILKKIGSPTVPDLVRALDRPDGLVVQRVCWALGDIKDSAAVQPLIGISGHQRWQVRDQAVGALGKIGDRAADPVVIGALVDTIGQVRKSAAVACGRLAVDDAVPQLVHMLGDEFYGARLSAYHTLIKLDTTTVVAVLKDSVNTRSELTAGLCCQLLGEYGSDEAIEILLKQTRSENPAHRAHAALAIIAADPLDNCNYRRRFVPKETDRLVRLKIESAIRVAETAADELEQP